MFKDLYSKEKEIRKKAVMAILKEDLSDYSEDKLSEMFIRLKQIIENDDADVKYFAKKLLNKVKIIAEEKNYFISDNELEEIYRKKAEELVSLLESEDKLVRINALYAMAKTGNDEKYIKILEKFAENAETDEAELAIDAIVSIKSYIAKKEEKRKVSETIKKKTKETINEQKNEKTKIVVKEVLIEKENKFYKYAFFSSLFFVIFFILLYASTFFVKLKERNIVYLNRSFGKIVVIYDKNGKLNYSEYKLGLSGFKRYERNRK